MAFERGTFTGDPKGCLFAAIALSGTFLGLIVVACYLL